MGRRVASRGTTGPVLRKSSRYPFFGWLGSVLPQIDNTLEIGTVRPSSETDFPLTKPATIAADTTAPSSANTVWNTVLPQPVRVLFLDRNV